MRAKNSGNVSIFVMGLGLVLGLLAAHGTASAVCAPAGKTCGVPAAFNDRLCCPGTLCGWGGVCQPGCRIGGTFYRAGTVNPGDPCQRCEPRVSTTRWTAAPVCAVPFYWQDVSGSGTPILLNDDDVSAAIPLGFTIRYFGLDYDAVYVSFNGFLTVLPGQANGCCSGDFIPYDGDPNGVIAGWWEDLNPPAGGAIYYETLGLAPYRVFIVQFSSVPHYSSSDPVTFEFKLFEGTNAIEVHYLDAASDGGTHSAGIENETGTVGAQHYLGSAPLPPQSAVRYSPR